MEQTILRKGLNIAYVRWKKIARVIGKVNSFILLTVFYFLVFGFIAVMRKVVVLFLKKPVSQSYWIVKDKESLGNFEQQF